MEFNKFEDGSIVAYGVDDDGEALYEDYAIYSIEAEFEKSTIGIYCAKLVIGSGAPSSINEEAQEELCNSLGDEEVEDERSAKRCIRQLTGVDGDDITVNMLG